MSIDFANLIISVVSIGASVVGTIVYMKTKITVLETDLNMLREDTEKNINSSYDQIQIFITNISKDLTAIKSNTDKLEKSMLKTIDEKIRNNKAELITLISRIEIDLSNVSKDFGKFRENIYSKYDKLKEDLNSIVSDIIRLDNNIKLMSKEFLPIEKAMIEYLRKDMFNEKETIIKKAVDETKKDIEHSRNKLNKLETDFIELLTLIKKG